MEFPLFRDKGQLKNMFKKKDFSNAYEKRISLSLQ